MLSLCIYEPVMISVSTVSVEHLELYPVTTGSSGRTKYSEREIVTSSKDITIVIVSLVGCNVAFY